MSYETSSAPRALSAIRKTRRLLPVLLCLVAGVLLLLWGGRLTGLSARSSAPDPTAPPGESYEMSIDAYRASLEARLADACRRVRGAGDVTVIVTLGGGFQSVYAADVRESASGVATTYVTVGSGTDKRLILLTERTPPVVGIGVICSGGGDPTVRQEITALLSAACGVGASHIYVTGKG